MSGGVVLVTGATGGIGGAVVRRLVAAGRSVRAGSRDPDRHSFPPGVEPVRLDLERPGTLRAATTGVAAIVAAHGADDAHGPDRFQRIDYRGTAALLGAAHRATRFLYVSSIYTARDEPPEVEPGEPFRWKREAERAIRASGLPYVIVRPSWLDDGPGGKRGVRAEQGDTSDGTIARDQVAAVLVAALETEAAVGRTFEVYGDDRIPPDDWVTFFAPLVPDLEEVR